MGPGIPTTEQGSGLMGDPIAQISDRMYSQIVGNMPAFIVTGGFTNPHVWAATGNQIGRVSGSPVPNSNPVNCVEISASNPSTVFIGCDVGIYCSKDAGHTW